jgi:hypothetical protein
MISLQNLPPPGTPLSNTLQVAIKNNQQPVWYFADKLPLQAVFLEDGRIERGQFLETWKSLPDSNEVSAFLCNIECGPCVLLSFFLLLCTFLEAASRY